MDEDYNYDPADFEDKPEGYVRPPIAATRMRMINQYEPMQEEEEILEAIRLSIDLQNQLLSEQQGRDYAAREAAARQAEQYAEKQAAIIAEKHAKFAKFRAIFDRLAAFDASVGAMHSELSPAIETYLNDPYVEYIHAFSRETCTNIKKLIMSVKLTAAERRHTAQLFQFLA